MIPKIINYCWFGRKPKPKIAEKCIASWKKYCPDYEIIEWNEDNFDINYNEYTRYCYEIKNWAFLSDFVRLVVVYQHGGIYLDTDVEVIRPLDPLLENEAYFGFETDKYINTGLGFGAVAYSALVGQMLKQYEILPQNQWGITGCPILNTAALVKLGLQQNGKSQFIENVTVYPSDFFNPYDDSTGILNKTSNTYSIHWYGKSWMSKKSRIRSTLSKPLHRIQKLSSKRKEK